jgi:hypothetical protein
MGLSVTAPSQPVENDVFFLSRKGVFVLGNEPNITAAVLRTNEISAKVRTTFQAMNQQYLQNAAAVYFDTKYILTYPASGQSNNTQMIIYDRERLAWMGPWTIGANGFDIYNDSSGGDHLVYGDTGDAYVTEASTLYKDDKSSIISTFLRTKQEDLGDWSLFKTIRNAFYNFRNVLGSINVNERLETYNGRSGHGRPLSPCKAWGAAQEWVLMGWG